PGGRAEHRRDPGRAGRGGASPGAGRARGTRGGRGQRRRCGDPGRRAGGLGARLTPPRAAGARRARHRSRRPARTAARGRDRPPRGPSRGWRGRPRPRRAGHLRARADPLRGLLGGRRRTEAGLAKGPRELPLRALGGSRGGPAGPGGAGGPGPGDARRRRARRRAARAHMERGRPHAAARHGWHQEPPGPVHRPRGAPLVATSPARGDGGRSRRLGRRRGRLGGLPPGPPGPRDRRPNGVRPGLMNDSAIGEVLVPSEDLQRRVAELGAEISRDYEGRDLVMIGVLKGALLFIADLMRHLTVPCEVDFMAVSSYGSSTDSSGVVRILKDLEAPIGGRDVLIVEDIIDSGLTLQYLLRNLRARSPGSLEVCALLTKPARRRVELPIRYVGFEIPNRFVIGYGLDYAQRYRNLSYVAVLDDERS